MSPFILPPFCATYLTLSRRDLIVGLALDQAVGDYESLYHFRVAED